MKPVKFVVINVALLALLVAPVALADQQTAATTAEPVVAEPAALEPMAEPAAETDATDPKQQVPDFGEDTHAIAALDPAAFAGDEAVLEGATAAPLISTARPLGQIGYDSEGRQGRIHVVVGGDTLWDISEAYLGTPWVWPSIWTDNRNIENPHLIHPRDHIWITESEMRVVTPEEAEAMLATRPAAPQEFPMAEPQLAAAPVEIAPVADVQQFRRVSVREWVGLISDSELEVAASIVKRISDRVMLAQIDEVYIGLGEGEIQVGDEFDIIRDDAKVYDPKTGRFLGHHVVVLGWLQVKEVFGETARAKIRQSVEDIAVGDKLIPRRPESVDIAIRRGPDDVEGSIAFFPRGRVVIGPLDFVYLNRGTLDGLEAGSPLEVFRGGEVVREPTIGGGVAIPNRVVAKLLVVDAQPETAVALVSEAETDLYVGDNFRGASN